MLQIVSQLNGEGWTFGFRERRYDDQTKYPVSPANLRIAMGLYAGPLSTEGMDLPIEQILYFLKENGRTLDGNLNIRHVVREPLLNIRCGYIGAMVQMHLDACRESGWNPEDTPMHLYWCPEMGQRAAMKVDQKMTQIPDNQQGAINMYDGDQIVLSYREWHFVPRNERILYMRRNLQVTPTFAKSVKALCTESRVIVDDGRLIKSGIDKLWITDLELSKVIAGVVLREPPKNDQSPPPEADQSGPTHGPMAPL